MKGHKDSSGKFHPHSSSSGISSGQVLDDPYAKQKKHSKHMRKTASPSDYLKYYYSIPYRLRKQYGVPNKAPKFTTKKKSSNEAPTQYAPKQKGESTLHYQARTGLILIPHHWEWSQKQHQMIDTKTGKPIMDL